MVKTKKQHKSKQKKTIKRSQNYRGGLLDEDVKAVVASNIEKRSPNLAKMLAVACKNPDNCLAIGEYDAIIKIFFEDFRNFNLVDKNLIKRIGNPSANGFVLEFPFEKEGYRSYSILKCSVKNTADNLFFEYFVGKYFINNYLKKFPCFVETYDSYRIKDDSTWDTLKNGKDINNLNLSDQLIRIDSSKDIDNLFAESCIESKNLCVLIQHFDNFISLHEAFKKHYDNIQYEMQNYFFQVYYVLSTLGNKYTHYDLHPGNVFLYKPYEGKQYIQMRYHDIDSAGKEIGIFEFPSEYIVKIIDYGRNYFNNGVNDTNNILNEYICPAKECQPNCGERNGYNNIQGDLIKKREYFYDINPNKPNKSHDLRLFYAYAKYARQFLKFKKIYYKDMMGTPERDTDTFDMDMINNIHDLLRILKNQINDFNQNALKNKYKSEWKHVATMDIYNDGRDYSFKVETPDFSEIAPVDYSIKPTNMKQFIISADEQPIETQKEFQDKVTALYMNYMNSKKRSFPTRIKFANELFMFIQDKIEFVSQKFLRFDIDSFIDNMIGVMNNMKKELVPKTEDERNMLIDLFNKFLEYQNFYRQFLRRPKTVSYFKFQPSEVIVKQATVMQPPVVMQPAVEIKPPEITHKISLTAPDFLGKIKYFLSEIENLKNKKDQRPEQIKLTIQLFEFINDHYKQTFENDPKTRNMLKSVFLTKNQKFMTDIIDGKYADVDTEIVEKLKNVLIDNEKILNSM